MKYIIAILLALTIMASPTLLIAANPAQISRATFCTGISDHEPINSPEKISVGEQTVYFFTEVRNGKDQLLTHKWFYNNVPIAEVPLRIGDDRWRTWSTKQVWHLTPGMLKVQVIDNNGIVLTEQEIPLQ
ncbi:MAG: hypothetical protein C0623_12575 [Desulfuromonas sp.]|nr:MAG: hypothetical protein C0623_12575 [Desulfuromonas sp.]